MDMTSVHDFVGITPKFIDLNGTADIEALHTLTVPSAQEVADDPSIKFKGKIVMALPPFLMKTHIDMDIREGKSPDDKKTPHFVLNFLQISTIFASFSQAHAGTLQNHSISPCTTTLLNNTVEMLCINWLCEI
jgi:hypothetical protein